MKLILFIFCLVMMSVTSAADFEQQSLKLCNKIKSCALADLDTEDLSAEMKTMIMASMDGMCTMMIAQYSGADKDIELHQEIAACMDSLSPLSCEDLMEGDSDTPACLELERLAATYE